MTMTMATTMRRTVRSCAYTSARCTTLQRSLPTLRTCSRSFSRGYRRSGSGSIAFVRYEYVHCLACTKCRYQYQCFSCVPLLRQQELVLFVQVQSLPRAACVEVHAQAVVHARRECSGTRWLGFFPYLIVVSISYCCSLRPSSCSDALTSQGAATVLYCHEHGCCSRAGDRDCRRLGSHHGSEQRAAAVPGAPEVPAAVSTRLLARGRRFQHRQRGRRVARAEPRPPRLESTSSGVHSRASSGAARIVRRAADTVRSCRSRRVVCDDDLRCLVIESCIV